jgi:hypothetical protein
MLMINLPAGAKCSSYTGVLLPGKQVYGFSGIRMKEQATLELSSSAQATHVFVQSSDKITGKA